MKHYLIRLFVLTFLLTSCDKDEKQPKTDEKSTKIPRGVKPVVSSSHSAPDQNGRLRSSFQEATKLSTPEERNRAFATVAWDALELDQDLAMEAYTQMTTGSEEKNQLLGHMVMRSAERNVEDATTWVTNTLGTDAEKSLAFGKIALVVSEKEPERAAKILSESGVAGHDLDVAVVQVVQRWAASSPAAAAAWVSTFKAGDARSAGLEQIVTLWIQEDPAAAYTWIPTLKDKKVRQEVELGAAQAIINAPSKSQASLLKFASSAIRANFEKLKTQAATQSR